MVVIFVKTKENIYYEGSRIPSGWSSGWNSENRPVKLNSKNNDE